MDMVAARQLTKRFGPVTSGSIAVDHVDLVINQHEVYALIGPNGAGKTTFLKMIVGLLSPTSGSVSLCGHDIAMEPLAAKRSFGYVPDDPAAYDYLTGLEFLSLAGRLRHLPPAKIHERIGELLKIFPLGNIPDQPMSLYSRGNKQKLAILASLISEPKVLIIDEPIVGLDPESIEILGKTLVSYAKLGNSVLFVTHILSFAREFATHTGVMKQGKLVENGKAAKSKYSH